MDHVQCSRAKLLNFWRLSCGDFLKAKLWWLGRKIMFNLYTISHQHIRHFGSSQIRFFLSKLKGSREQTVGCCRSWIIHDISGDFWLTDFSPAKSPKSWSEYIRWKIYEGMTYELRLYLRIRQPMPACFRCAVMVKSCHLGVLPTVSTHCNCPFQMG